MENIKQNLIKVNQRIYAICKKTGRNINNIKIVAVSKKKSINFIKEAIKYNQYCFGENYVKESIKKIKYFANNKKLEWHFIGKIQSNKAKAISNNFKWCHTVDSIDIAKKLNNYRNDNLNKLNILIQININNEKNKSGILLNNTNELSQITKLIKEIILLKKLKLRGLMIIPDINKKKYSDQLYNFLKISKILKNLKKKYKYIDTLSMGMSNDLEAAIEAGSNMLRIGESIFGKRI